MTKKNMGRPTKLTIARHRQIVKLVREGNYMETAAATAGISKDVLFTWLRRGARKSKGIHHEFSVDMEKARAEAEIKDVRAIGNASFLDWKAAAFRLERRHPKRWGKKVQTALTGADGGAIRLNINKDEAEKVLGNLFPDGIDDEFPEENIDNKE